MNNKFLKLALGSLVCSTLLATSAQAFDEKREGFILGLGAGLSSVASSGDLDDTSVGFATSFKIGYGFNEQFSLYYVRNASWFGYDDDPDEDTYASGISGVGASYYISPNDPAYVMAAVGFGDFSNVTENAGETGSAFMLGGGYEIYPHVHLEGTYLVADIEEDGVDLTTSAFQLTINYLWY